MEATSDISSSMAMAFSLMALHLRYFDSFLEADANAATDDDLLRVASVRNRRASASVAVGHADTSFWIWESSFVDSEGRGVVVGIPLTPMDGRNMWLPSSPYVTSTDPLGEDACTDADFEDGIGRVGNASELWWTGVATPMMVLPYRRTNHLREFVTFMEKGTS